MPGQCAAEMCGCRWQAVVKHEMTTHAAAGAGPALLLLRRGLAHGVADLGFDEPAHRVHRLGPACNDRNGGGATRAAVSRRVAQHASL